MKSTRLDMTRRKRFAFALIAMALGLTIPMAVLLGIDMFLHQYLQRFSDVSVWGYRGPTVHRRQPGEHRLVVLGGSTAFGWGVPWNQAFPAQLQTALDPLARNHAPVTVVNLGMVAHGAYSFRFTLEDYAKLDYDAAILYEGYNDLGEQPNLYVGRRDSPIYRLTGYYPILPTAVRELATLWRTGGRYAAAADRDGRVVFEPGLASRTSAEALEVAGRIEQALDAQLDRFARSSALPRGGVALRVGDAGCPPRWAHYCGSVYDAVAYALSAKKKVLVVTQPYMPPPHPEEQQALREMIARKFGGDSRVGYVDLGSAIDTKTSDLAYDHMHLTAAGNAVIAAHLVPAVVALMPEAFNRPNVAAGAASPPR